MQLAVLPKDERVVTSTGALALQSIPGRMLVIGAGIIGLEMATVYSALGAKIDLVERLPDITAGVDADAVKIWRSRNAHRFEHIDVASSVSAAEITPDGVTVGTTGASVRTRSYDLVLQSAGRVPNSSELGLERIDVAIDPNGFIQVDKQMRTTARNVFAIGDVVGGSMLAHKAVHEGTSPRKLLPGSRRPLRRRSSPMSPTPILRSPGSASPSVMSPNPEGRSVRQDSHGPRPVGPSRRARPMA